MSRQRLVILILGVVGLAAVSVWRLSSGEDGPPASPPTPTRESGAAGPGRSPRITEEDGLVHLKGETMGTTFSIKCVAPHPGVLDLMPVAVDGALEDVNASMSTYDPKSELSLLNRLGADTPIPVSEPLFFVLELAAKTTEATDGAFDVTVAPLVRAFGFGAGAASEPPTQAELENLRKDVGMHLLELDPTRSTVLKRRAGTEIDLSAIAKGYGVDHVADALEHLDIDDYMVEVGGEIRVAGTKPQGRPWRLAIEHPDPEARRLYATLTLPPGSSALATSGDYRNFRKVGEEWISHTIDPRVGRPVPRRTASVSVVRPTAAEADALATALGVLEPGQALTLANAQGWAVLLLVRRGEDELERLASEAFQEMSVDYVDAR